MTPQMSAPTKNYFGLPDATEEAESTIIPNHVQRDFEGNIKFGDRVEGDEIVVGIKGSGKTALRRYIERSDASSLFWNLDCDHSRLDIDASSLKRSSGILRDALALYLLRGCIQFLLEEKEALGLSGRIKSLLECGNRTVVEALKNIPSAIDFKTPLGQLNIHELLKFTSARYVESAWKNLRKHMVPIVEAHRVYIMIDDVEDYVVPGIQNNPEFIEGLARAVHAINHEFGSSLHVLLFLKHGLWRKWYQAPREYDKVENVIQHVSWDHAALCEVIARRISTMHHKKLDIQKLWTLEFHWGPESTFEGFTQEITKYCVSGPRDIIVLANKAKSRAGGDKITANHIKGVLREYSEMKVYELAADFGDVYPDVQIFVEKVFQGVPEEMHGDRYADWIEHKALVTKKVNPNFTNLPWYSVSSKERLTKVMYDIGLLGKVMEGGQAVYTMQKPVETPTDLMDGVLTVHPAFRPHLRTIKANKRRPRRR